MCPPFVYRNQRRSVCHSQFDVCRNATCQTKENGGFSCGNSRFVCKDTEKLFVVVGWFVGPVVPDVLNVVVVVQHFQQAGHFDDEIGVIDCGLGGGDVCDLGRGELIALLLEVFSDRTQIFGCAGDLGHAIFKGEVFSAGFKNVFHQDVFGEILIFVIHGDDTLLGEHEGNAAVLAKVAAELIKVVTDITGGAVTVIGESFYDDGNAAGAVAFVHDFFVVVFVGITGSFFDDALDVLVGDVAGLGFGNEVSQLAVGIGIGAAFFNSNGNLTANLGKDFRFLAVGLFFLLFNVVPFGMSGHPLSPFRSYYTCHVQNRHRKCGGILTMSRFWRGNQYYIHTIL